MPRARRHPAFPFAAAVALVGSLVLVGTAGAAETGAGDRLAQLVAAVAGRPVSVSCETNKAAWEHEVAGAELAAQAVAYYDPELDDVRFGPLICRDIVRSRGRVGPATLRALFIAAHEGAHARGIEDEGVANCWGLYWAQDLARRFYDVRFFTAQSRRVRVWARQIQRDSPREYRAACPVSSLPCSSSGIAHGANRSRRNRHEHHWLDHSRGRDHRARGRGDRGDAIHRAAPDRRHYAIGSARSTTGPSARHRRAATAERDLKTREERFGDFEARPLTEASRARFTQDWDHAERLFVDDPEGAAREADRVVRQVLDERGYPDDDLDTRAAAVSVGHPMSCSAIATGTRWCRGTARAATSGPRTSARRWSTSGRSSPR